MMLLASALAAFESPPPAPTAVVNLHTAKGSQGTCPPARFRPDTDSGGIQGDAEIEASLWDRRMGTLRKNAP